MFIPGSIFLLLTAYFEDRTKRGSMTPEVECTQKKWDDFLAEAVELAKRLGLQIQITGEP